MKTNPAMNRREVLDCGGKSDATPLFRRARESLGARASGPLCARDEAKATTIPPPVSVRQRKRAGGPRAVLFAALSHREIRGQFLLALVLVAVGLAGGAGAATLTVTNLADSGPGTLRQHVAEAQPNDTIDFAVTGTITLTSGELVIQTNLTIQGPGAANLTVSGNSTSRVIRVAGGNLNLNDLAVSNGKVAAEYGGGIYNELPGTLIIRRCVISSNLATHNFVSGGGAGGGIFNSGNLELIQTSVTANWASVGGGGIFNLNQLHLLQCTVAGNRSSGDEGRSSRGGGILNQGMVALTNSTVSNNSADYGGGIGNLGSIVSRNTTIAENASELTDTADVLSEVGSFSLFSTIVGRASGIFVSEGFNLIGSVPAGSGLTNGLNHDQVGIEPARIDLRIGPLMDNGGPTITHDLLIGSPAIDQGRCNDSAVDQRGIARPVDASSIMNAFDGCDVGALEKDYTPPRVHVVSTLHDMVEGSFRRNTQIARAGDFIVFATNGLITLTNGPLLIDRDLTIVGSDARSLTVSANNVHNVVTVQRGTVSISGLTIAHGATRYGGGILNGATLLLSECFLSENSASHIEGGGGIVNFNVARIARCTLSDNFARRGGGMANYGIAFMENCTVSGNTCSPSDGGGIWNGGLLFLSSCTIVSNLAGVSAGGGIRDYGTGLTCLKSTLVAANTADTSGPDCRGDFVSDDFNLIQFTNGASFSGAVAHNLYGLDPLLGPLQDNGGPTWTHALLPGSPALDAGHSGGLSTDQRGGARAVRSTTNNVPGSDGSDIGAFEAGGYVRLTSIARTNTTAHLQLSKDLTTGPGPAFYVQRRAAFGTGRWEELHGAVSGTNALLPFADTTATNAQNFYRARVGP